MADPGNYPVLRWFKCNHLNGDAKEVAYRCKEFADYVAENGVGGAELAAGLRKLLEAKDCFVRDQIQEQ